MKKCTACKIDRELDTFMSKTGREFKQCLRCREMKRIKSYCEHDRRRNECKECGGVSVCEHDRIRSKCKECGGGSICEHDKIKSQCKECGGVSVCEHDRIRSKCKECGGGSICEHNKQRSSCKECRGSSICEHNRIRSSCKECGGSSICEHNRIRSSCKECGDEIMKTIKTMVLSSRRSDKLKNLYDANTHIDIPFIESLIYDYGTKCFYCDKETQFIKYQDDLITIERINNKIGHSKANCVLCCKNCNITKVGDKINQLMN